MGKMEQMGLMDKDLLSVQEARDLLEDAYVAQKALADMNQAQIDLIVKAIADAGSQNAVTLAKMAVEETDIGKWEDKVMKNQFASKTVYEAIKDMKTVGILGEDKKARTMDIGVPVGVIVGLIPTTNPTSTVIYKAMIAIKSGNSIVFSPHPSAKKSILETAKIVSEAAEHAGCPQGAIGCMSTPSLDATTELMRNKLTSLILATGGEAMVRSAYSSGKPAIGVGPGNAPVFIDKSANIKQAVKRIMDSKTFDYGTICASEHSVIVEKSMEESVKEELKNQGAYFLNEEESKKLEKFIIRPNGVMNPQIVGKSAQSVAKFVGIDHLPTTIKVLVAKESRIGANVPYSKEKLGPILAFYVEDDVEAVLEKSIQILRHEGRGHTFSMHATDQELIKKFALRMPASRILINTPSALGGIGGSTNLFPALTLGCGAIGGSSTSNNVGPLDLIDVKKVAFGVREIEEIKHPVLSGKEFEQEDTGVLIDFIVKQIMNNLNKKSM